MAFIKSLVFILLVVPFVSVMIFILSIHTNEETFTLIYSAFILLNLVLLVLGIIGSGKSFTYVLSTKLRNTLAITTSIILIMVASIILFSNFVIYGAERVRSGTDSVQLSKSEKVEWYKSIYNKVTNQQYDLEHLEARNVDHITFYYEKNFNPDEVIKLTLETIQEYENDLDALFPENKAMPVKFILYNDYNKFASNYDELRDGKVGGFYDPSNQTIHFEVPHDPEFDLNEIKGTVIHEYVHHMYQSYKKENGLRGVEPIWFIEGIAAYVEKKYTMTYSEEFMGVEFVSFTKLDAVREWDEHLQVEFSPYLQSYLLINYIIENHGSDVVSTILLKSDNISFDEALEDTLGSPIEVYESQFLEELRKVESIIDSFPKLIYQENKPEKALESLTEVIRIAPNHHLANHNIANIYQELGEYEKALEYREKVVILDPEHSPSYSYLAETLLFIDINKALEAEITGYEYAEKDPYSNLSYNEDRVKNLEYIHENIENGNPFRGYVSLLKEGNSWMFNELNKTDLIKKVLDEYPNIQTKERDQLVDLLNE
ncbi:collagenase [Bacillus suaedaesalsae]|uniref:Collagenase n=1 Tax=Bacillus suaedaesalsae TaxID=2810349 RepID=A0ABS2DDI5_9BACI|nr:collagenase [Bacillus suaedaesalsae]MBM6616514.1 collagenase [Bacillus suaedaesalsae]